jgi:xanthine dehydrogenase accessory factor
MHLHEFPYSQLVVFENGCGSMKEQQPPRFGDVTDKIYHEIVRLRSEGASAALATVIRTTGSTPGAPLFKMLVYPDAKTLGTVGGGAFEAKVVSEAVRVITSQEPTVFDFSFRDDAGTGDQPICGGKMEIFIEPIRVKSTLYVMGAGHIGQVVARIGKITGFRVVVVDDREEYANRERFPDADEIRLLDFSNVADEITVNQSSHIVIVTRGHQHDQSVLEAFIRSNAGYLGMLGSKRKVKEVFQNLRDHGIDTKLLDRVHAPIGVDIGARTPAEIAVSIIAEIIAHIRGKDTK